VRREQGATADDVVEVLGDGPGDREPVEPFVQVDASRTRASEGTGLGLAISRDLARGMKGDLVAESTPGEGSVFTVTLPSA
jgi:signal transduction histidine kinase